MAIEKDNIKDLFSAKLGDNFDPEVPASVWAGIDQLLPHLSTPAPDPSSTASSSTSSTSSASSTSSTAASSTASTAKVVAIATGVAASVATGVIVMNYDDPAPKESAVIAPVVIDTPTDTLSIEEFDEDTEYKITPIPYKKTEIKEIAEVAESRESTPNVSETEEKELKGNRMKVESLLDYYNIVAEESSVMKSITSGMSVGLMANADLMSGNMSQSGGVLLMSPHNYTKYLSALERSNNDYEIEHSQPISFGLSVGKQISPKLSIETGLVYTYLSSTAKASGNYLIDEKQTFHYLGLPLSINYTFYQLKKTKFYVSLGGMVQKDIQGRYTGQINKLSSQLDQNINSDLLNENDFSLLSVASSKTEISQDNPQFSGRMAIGVSTPIYRKLSLYGKVGGAYYFDAGNKYRTIYSDQKLQLDLNVGLKIDF